MDVVTLGETMAMLVPPTGAVAVGDPCELHAGGAESNVAIHLARLGMSATWVSALGDDALGRMIREGLGAAGVHVDARVDPSRPTGLYVKERSGDRTQVRYYRSTSAASTLGREDALRVAEARPRAVIVSGITPALSTSAADAIHALIHDRVAGSAEVIFDVNYRPALWLGRDAGDVLLELANASDVVLVGLDEAAALWGVRRAEDVRALVTAPTLVVKDGATEAVSFHGEEMWRVPARRVEVVEPVGAGDAFLGGWLAGRMQGQHPVVCLRLGHAVAARVLGSSSDDAPLPPFAELLDENTSPEDERVTAR